MICHVIIHHISMRKIIDVPEYQIEALRLIKARKKPLDGVTLQRKLRAEWDRLRLKASFDRNNLIDYLNGIATTRKEFQLDKSRAFKPRPEKRMKLSNAIILAGAVQHE
jgi:hypothetical protein